MEEKFEQVIKSIPEDFEILLKALGNIFRFKLGLFLFANKPLTFTSFSREFNKEPSYIYNHIKDLELAGVIQNYIKKNKDIKEYSYYEITEFGKIIYSQILDNYFKFFSINAKSLQLFFEEYKAELDIFLKGIRDKFRFALILFLKEFDSLSFTQIQKSTQKTKGSISNHLKKLELAGIIQNYYKKTSNSEEYSFYEVTDFGNKMISSLINTYNDFYRNIKEKFDKRRSKKKEDNNYIKAGCGNWASYN